MGYIVQVCDARMLTNVLKPGAYIHTKLTSIKIQRIILLLFKRLFKSCI